MAYRGDTVRSFSPNCEGKNCDSLSLMAATALSDLECGSGWADRVHKSLINPTLCTRGSGERSEYLISLRHRCRCTLGLFRRALLRACFRRREQTKIHRCVKPILDKFAGVVVVLLFDLGIYWSVEFAKVFPCFTLVHFCPVLFRSSYSFFVA